MALLQRIAKANLLNYVAMIEDGIIVCKPGTLIAAWVYIGKDDASKTEAELEQPIALLNPAILPLEDGWMLHTDNVRYEAPGYPDRGRCHLPLPFPPP